MPRQYLGAHEVNIPVEDILRDYAAWSDEIVDVISMDLLKEVRAQARVAFKDKTKLLRKNIKRKKSKYDKGTVIVGAFAPHAHLVEFGHDITTTKKGEVIGHVPAYPFMSIAAKSIETRLESIVQKVVPVDIEVKR